MTRRTTKQQGCLYEENGNHYIRFRVTRMVDGQLKRVRISKSVAPKDGCSKRRARELANEILVDVNRPQLEPEKALTLAAFVEDVYFPHAKKRLRPSTIEGYSVVWRRLAPHCVDRKHRPLWVRDAGVPEVQRILESLADTAVLGKKALQHTKAFLSGVFRLALQQGFHKGTTNPVQQTSLPKARPSAATYAYNLKEISQFLAALPEPAATIVATAAFAGLRKGEISGGLWENLHDAELFVSQSIWNGHATEPKTEKSKAAVPVIRQLAERLEMHRLRCGNPTSGPIFANGGGKPADLGNVLNRVILPILKRDPSLPRWHGWHAFRRGLATNLNELGVDDLTIQRILRHENVGTTQACYIKPRDKKTHEAMEQLQAALDAPALTATVQ